MNMTVANRTGFWYNGFSDNEYMTCVTNLDASWKTVS